MHGTEATTAYSTACTCEGKTGREEKQEGRNALVFRAKILRNSNVRILKACAFGKREPLLLNDIVQTKPDGGAVELDGQKAWEGSPEAVSSVPVRGEEKYRYQKNRYQKNTGTRVLQLPVPGYVTRVQVCIPCLPSRFWNLSVVCIFVKQYRYQIPGTV